MKIKHYLALFSFLATFGIANAIADETQRFTHRETEDETAEWQIEIQISGSNVSGTIKTFSLKPVDNPASKVWTIDKESKPDVTAFSGKVLAGSAERLKKLEIKLEGDQPMWIAFNNGKASWTMLSKTRQLDVIQVPVSYTLGMNHYKKTLNFQLEGSDQVDKPKSNAASAGSDHSRMLVGNWGGGELVMKFDEDFSYSFEAEGSVFERGKWKLSGDKLLLTNSAGKPDRASIKFISENALDWKNKQGNVTRMARL
jgi:hypothetical protein